LTDRELYEHAAAAEGRAYAPYSRFRVGAAVLLTSGDVVTGVNVENASYPLGMCAERCALARAVAEGARPGEIEAVAVTASPCGGQDLLVRAPEELLPHSFELAPERA
jgi:cytidine deaminase